MPLRATVKEPLRGVRHGDCPPRSRVRRATQLRHVGWDAGERARYASFYTRHNGQRQHPRRIECRRRSCRSRYGSQFGFRFGDFVEASNLQRQVLFDEADAAAATPKAEAARHQIARFNSDIHVHAHVADLVPANIHALLAGANLILDATDNFETRYLINDYSIESGSPGPSIPWIYAAAVGAYAATMNILPGETACLACLFPKPPTGPVETCDTAGILNTTVNLAASIQVTEAIKYLTGGRDAMRRTLLSWDLWQNERSEISAAHPRTDCEVCGLRDFAHLRGEGRPHITLCGRNSVQIHEHHRPVDLAAAAERLRPHGEVRQNGLLLQFRRGPHTLTLFADGRALIQGTTDIALARTLYARFVGN
jgi:molybdopterin/thiamine biosynthesis adenylyltransferase